MQKRMTRLLLAALSCLGGLTGTAPAGVLDQALLRLEAANLTFDPTGGHAGAGRQVWVNTGTAGATYNATSDTYFGRNVTQQTYTLLDGVTTAQRLAFNGTSSGFADTLRMNRAANLTAFVVAEKIGPSANYQNLFSFDGGTGGWSRGMGFVGGNLQVQTKNGATAWNVTDAAPGTNRVLGISFAGDNPQTITAYVGGASIPGPGNPYTASVNDDGSLSIGYLDLPGAGPHQFFGGTIAALLIWDRLLTSTEVTQVERYLTDTYIGSATPGAVPEIDPAGLGTVLALLTGTLGLLERRRLEAA